MNKFIVLKINCALFSESQVILKLNFKKILYLKRKSLYNCRNPIDIYR